MLILQDKKYVKNLLKNHILVIVIFIGLTFLFLYPALFHFDQLPGSTPRDLVSRLWSLWWYNFSLTDSNLSIFTTEYSRYPFLEYMPAISPFNAILSIPLNSIWGIDDVYKILLYSTFVLTGYTTFHLANYLTKNYPASIVAGIIFTFSVFHIHHAKGHLGLATLYFIPLFILLLFITEKSNKIKYPIIGGMLFFLVFISQWYLAYFTILFFLVFFIYHIIKNRDKQFLVKMGLLIGVFLILSSPFVYFSLIGHFESGGSTSRPIEELEKLSLDVVNYVKFPKFSFFQNTIFPDEPGVGLNKSAYIGFGSLFLMIIGLIRIKKADTLFWVITGLVFFFISLGPVLKFDGELTGIPLPYILISEFPLITIFRAIGRAEILVFLAISILAAMGLSYILSKNNISNTRKTIIYFSITGFIVFELLLIPFPTQTLQVPEIYYEIANDPNFFVVMEIPLGGNGDLKLAGDSMYKYFQTVHEKPILNGGVPRTPFEIQRHLQTYFLNNFIGTKLDPPNVQDIVIQDLEDVGISVFNYYDIEWVLIHKKVSDNILKNRMWPDYLPYTTNLIENILKKQPDYEDQTVKAYKIPTSLSKTPFIILDKGWSPVVNTTRSIGHDATMIVVNPEKFDINVILEFQVIPYKDGRIIKFLTSESVYEEKLDIKSWKNITIPIKLNPGSNVIHISSNTFDYDEPLSRYEKPLQKSVIFKKITMTESNG